MGNGRSTEIYVMFSDSLRVSLGIRPREGEKRLQAKSCVLTVRDAPI
jgi:hypothetical protein